MIIYPSAAKKRSFFVRPSKIRDFRAGKIEDFAGLFDQSTQKFEEFLVPQN